MDNYIVRTSENNFFKFQKQNHNLVVENLCDKRDKPKVIASNISKLYLTIDNTDKIHLYYLSTSGKLNYKSYKAKGTFSNASERKKFSSLKLMKDKIMSSEIRYGDFKKLSFNCNLKLKFNNTNIPKIFYVHGSRFILCRNSSNLIYQNQRGLQRYVNIKQGGKITMYTSLYISNADKILREAKAKIMSTIMTNVKVTSKENFYKKQNKIEGFQHRVETDDKNNIEASIIIPCKNEKENLKKTVDSILASYNNVRFEIIIVDDASIDNSTEFLKLEVHNYKNVTLINTENLGCAGAKNRGAKIAKGKYLFFIDAHVKVADYWLDTLVNTMKYKQADAAAPAIKDFNEETAFGYGETWTNNLNLNWLTSKPNDIITIPIACGCAFGIKKSIFNEVGCFNELFKVWGREDEEISLKLCLYGFNIVVNPGVMIDHKFRKSFPYKVTPINIVYNTLVMAYSHFNKQRLLKTIEILKLNPSFYEAGELVKENFDLIMKQRDKYLDERKFEDNYFLKNLIFLIRHLNV